MAVSKAELVACMVSKAGIFRPRELDRVGYPPGNVSVKPKTAG
jgi:hypothetical protein